MTQQIVGRRWTCFLGWIGTLGVVVALVACGGGGGADAIARNGSLRVALTDAPSCGFDHVWVTVDKVSVNQNANAAESDVGWSDLPVSPARRIDLLGLTNGILEELGTATLPAGQYSQIRLVLANNGSAGASALANAVQPTGAAETALATPSAQQSGLKLQTRFDVVAGQMADLVLDFDACKSIVKAGNSGKYNLKPVISVHPRGTASGIQGFVATTLPLSSTTVAAQQDGVTIRSTAPDSAGKFNIPFLAPGTYSLVVQSEGHATAVVLDIPTTSTTTAVNGTATVIAPPVSGMADITGTVTLTSISGSSTVSAVLTDANARALQALTGGPIIEVGNQPVDAALGTYRFHLPVGAPVKAIYVPGGTLTFATDVLVAGKYSIQVASPGRTTQEKLATVSGGTSTAVNFSFSP